MIGYAAQMQNIRSMLFRFKQRGVIDKNALKPLDELIQLSYADQIKVLNTPILTLDQQRALFGAIRNMHTTAKTMREKLATASEKHENPTTADLSLEVTESMLTLTPYIDNFFSRGEMPRLRTINDFSRILHKKATHFGFTEDIATQFKALNIGPTEIKSFTEKLNQNIQAETDIDEAEVVGSTNEGSN